MKWYKYDIRDLADEEYHKWYSLMTEKKQRRVDRFRFNDDRRRTVAGEMLTRKAIAECCCVTTESIVFDTKENGKPYVVNLNVEFNISHSGDIVVCAVDDKPIGIDIEKIRPIDLSISYKFCNNDELNYIFDTTISKEEALIRFFKIWTYKEAYFKFFGASITDFKSIDYFNTDKNKIVIAYNEYIIHLVN